MNYLITTPEQQKRGLYKLGSAVNPWDRLQNFRTSLPNAFIHRTWEGNRASEESLKRQFKRLRVIFPDTGNLSEWFHVDRKFIDYLHEQLDASFKKNFQRVSLLKEQEMVKPLGVPTIGEMPQREVTPHADILRQTFIPEELPNLQNDWRKQCKFITSK